MSNKNLNKGIEFGKGLLLCNSRYNISQAICNSALYKHLGRWLGLLCRMHVNIIINTLFLPNFSKNQNTYLNNFLLVQKIK